MITDYDYGSDFKDEQQGQYVGNVKGQSDMGEAANSSTSFS